MSVKLLSHLRLLNPSLPVVRLSTMKLNTLPVKASRAIPIFSRVFPLKLKYQGFSKKTGSNQLSVGVGVRKFSTRSFRPRPGSASEVQASKSLIEDEAELSDWVSGLKSKSFPTKLYSDSDEDGRGSDRRRGREDSGGKRRRENDSGDDDVSNRRKGNRDSFGSFSGNSRGRGRFGGESDGGNEGYVSRRGENGPRGGMSRGGRGSDLRYGRDRVIGGADRGENGPRGGRGSELRYGRDRGTGGGYRGENGSRGGMSRGGMSRGGRGSELRYGRDRGTATGSDRGENGPRGGRGSELRYGRDRDTGGGDRGDTGLRGGFNRGERGSELRYSRGRGGDRGENGPRGGRDNMVGKRGGRSSELRYGRDQSSGGDTGLRKGEGLGRGALVMSDEDSDDEDDDEEGGEDSFSLKELISEEDSEDEIDDDDGVVDVLKKSSSFSRLGSRTGGKGGLRKAQGLVISDKDTVDDDMEEGGEGSFSSKELSSEEDSEEETDDDGVDEVLGNTNSLSRLGIKDNPSKGQPGKSDSYLSETRFDQCSVSPLSLKGIKDVGYEKMTVVQEATLPLILKGKDVLAKAKTGTGKTVAFLLPAIEVVVKTPPIDRDERRPPILVLVICPTRELASQAAAEAKTLLKYHPSIGVQVVIGGTRLPLEQKRMQANPCQLLVATPGRLKDHIENTAGFATRLKGVKVLVLDEADHLLDMGFRKDIEKIIAAVPKERQTLLFSATIPQEVRQICHIALKRDHEYINTVEEGSEETHALVKQMHLIAPLDKHFSLLYVLLKDHIADDVDYKVLVFCTTAMVTRLVANLLGELNLNVREIHSRKPQSYRTRVSDEFRKSKGLILVTSDVSARGVDYPDVTLVIQVGLPADRQQYIHRLGRTGRKGKEGQGILMLAPWEEFFLSSVKDLPITKSPVPSIDPGTTKKVEGALDHVEMKNKEAAYQAWLGYYNSNKNIGRDKCRLVELANEFSGTMGFDNPPAIPKLVLGKMGLRNIPGLRSK